MLTIRHIAILRKMKSGERLAEHRGVVSRKFMLSDLKVTPAQFKKLCDENLIQPAEELDKTQWYGLTDKGRQIET
jgi:predicted DNA-binding protein (MmcQ/YjbR family)